VEGVKDSSSFEE